MTSPGYMTPRDPNEPSLENIHPPKCTCGAAKHTVNKEIPRFHYAEANAVDRVIDEVKQFHFDLQEGDNTEPKRLSTINDILAVLKLLAQKV
jgi:hypothetical protein